MDTWELWVRERDTLRLYFKSTGNSRAEAQAKADEWQADGYKVAIYAGNAFAQQIVINEGVHNAH